MITGSTSCPLFSFYHDRILAYEPQTQNVVFVLKAKLPNKRGMANLMDEIEGSGTKQLLFYYVYYDTIMTPDTIKPLAIWRRPISDFLSPTNSNK
jgi:hypothetical protein